MWQISYEDKTVQIPEVEGFHDLTRLLATPGDEVHCTQMVETPDTMSEEARVMDAKALASYKQRIGELREALGEAMNDLGRA